MANRPAFIYSDGKLKKEDFDFTWYPGFSVSQKQKSIESLHESMKHDYPEIKVLEVSTKSPDEIGKAASAFNLSIPIKREKYTLEQLYQASKVFEKKGSQLSLLKENLDSRQIKKVISELNAVDKLVGFDYFGREFPLEPKTYFYNWLYINVLHFNEDIAREILKYDAFTDIEFNPKKSFSSQAEACGVYKMLVSTSENIDEVLQSPELFVKTVYKTDHSANDAENSDFPEQLSMF